MEKKLKVFTAFSGYDSQLMALDRLQIDYDCVGWSEIDKYAIQAHNALYPQYAERNYGDISKINWVNVPDFDLFTMSSPCFVKGTLVLTNSGYKKIDEITNSDLVLTHTNTFQKVAKPMHHTYNGFMYTIRSMMSSDIQCTNEHPFYVREMYRAGRKSERKWLEPKWVKAEDLTPKTFLGYAINTESSLPKWDGIINNMWGRNVMQNNISSKFTNTYFWYLMGRYVGDGWKKNGKSGSGIIICCGGRNEDKLKQAILKSEYNYNISTDRSVNKYTICSNELNKFVNRYGYYAHGKQIDFETMALPTYLLKSFIDGYIDSDGCYTNNEYKISSVSKTLITGLVQCIAKVYKCHVKLNYCKRKPRCVIEGRTVNQRDTYTAVWHTDRRKQDHAIYENGYIWYPISSINKEYVNLDVFNMEVSIDNSYTANGAIVHNCQDFSNAGLQRGGEEGSGTRSSLLWECRKAIEIKRPKYILFENVKALVTSKFVKGFNKWQKELEQYGYTNFCQVLNAKDYGVPQNRERIFMVSILGDAHYNFPKGFKLGKRLREVLDDSVDEKYYLSGKAMSYINVRIGIYVPDSYLLGYTRDNKGNIIDRHPINVSNTIHTSSGSGGNTDQFVVEPKIMQHNYRIRKLTERECFRLMGVSEHDIDKIKQAGISRTQQYKMAGNSIVVDVLVAIFNKLLVEKHAENQLSLF